jgi:hypothetical protein
VRVADIGCRFLSLPIWLTLTTSEASAPHGLPWRWVNFNIPLQQTAAITADTTLRPPASRYANRVLALVLAGTDIFQPTGGPKLASAVMTRRRRMGTLPSWTNNR